jgi:hypothetical protein
LCADAASLSDNSSPVLQGLAADRVLVATRDYLTLSADAYDIDSGLANITVRFENPQNGHLLAASWRLWVYDGESGGYRGKLYVPDGEEDGVFVLKSVMLTDHSQNRRLYVRPEELDAYPDAEALDFSLEFAVGTDRLPPALKDISVDSPAASPSGRLGLSAEARDDLAGVDRIALRFWCEDTGRNLFLELTGDDLDPLSGRYQGALTLSSDERPGNFVLKSAEISDRVGRKRRYLLKEDIRDGDEDCLPLPFGCGFAVLSEAGRAADPPDPWVTDIAVVRTEQTEDEYRHLIRVTAADGAPDFDHITVRFVNAGNDRAVSKVLRPSERSGQSSNVYEGWLSVSRYEPSGAFILDGITAVDQARRYQFYRAADNSFSSENDFVLPRTPSFFIASPYAKADDMPPVLTDISLDRDTVSPEGKILVTAFVTDDLTGVDEVTLKFRDPFARNTIVLNLKEENGIFTGAVEASKYRAGNYALVRLTVSDKLQNRRAYLPPDQPKSDKDGVLPRTPGFTIERGE